MSVAPPPAIVKQATGSAGVHRFGRTLVVAPHPDDESLGCGGLIALLRAVGCPVQVLVVGDGSHAHRVGEAFAPRAPADAPETETVAALGQLGLGETQVEFLRLADRALADERGPASHVLAEHLAATLRSFAPDTIVLPFRADGDPDHRAVNHAVRAAAAGHALLLEYAVMLGQGSAEALGTPGLVMWHIELGSATRRKAHAIAAYRSRFGLIDYDPGFDDDEPLADHFAATYELFFQFPRDAD